MFRCLVYKVIFLYVILFSLCNKYGEKNKKYFNLDFFNLECEVWIWVLVVYLGVDVRNLKWGSGEWDRDKKKGNFKSNIILELF